MRRARTPSGRRLLCAGLHALAAGILMAPAVPGGSPASPPGPSTSYRPDITTNKPPGYVGQTGEMAWHHYVARCVNSANGNLYFAPRSFCPASTDHDVTPDLLVRGRRCLLKIARSYNSHNAPFATGFGPGWTFNYNTYLLDRGDRVIWVGKDGSFHTFTALGDGQYESPPGIPARLSRDAGGFVLWLKTGVRHMFDATGKILHTVDKNGAGLHFTYSGEQLVQVEDDSGLALAFAYNGQGKISTITDPAGREVRYRYDSRGYLAAVTDPAGSTTVYGYARAERILARVTDRAGRSMRIAYDRSDLPRVTGIFLQADGREPRASVSRVAVCAVTYGGPLTTVTDARGGVRTILHNAQGSPAEMTDPGGFVTRMEWDSDLNLTRYTDQNGYLWAFAHDALGNTTSETDPAGQVVRYTWSSVASGSRYIALLVSETDRAGHSTTYEYDGNGNPLRVTGPAGHQIVFEYDGVGNPTRRTDALGNSAVFTYDVHGWLTTASDALGHTTQFTHDAVGRLTGSVDANGAVRSMAYDACGRLLRVVDPCGHATAYTCNGEGELTSVTDASGQVTQYQVNVLGLFESETRVSTAAVALSHNPRRQVRPRARGSSPGAVTLYSYDPVGNLIGVRDAKGSMTAYCYDAAGNLLSVTSPLGFVESFTYDGRGNRLTRTDANGTVTTYTYTPLNQLAAVAYPDGTGYTRSYDAKGNLAVLQNVGGLQDTTTYVYDPLSRVIAMSIDYGISGFSKAVTYTYNPNGDRTSILDPEGGATLFTYDAAGRLKEITSPPLGDVFSFGHDATGRRNALTYPNGVVTNYVHDPAGRLLESRVHGPGRTVIASYSYSYDAVGNRLDETETLGGLLTRATTYGYGSEHRLTSAVASDDARSYRYDLVGNRTETTVNGVTSQFSYDAEDRLLEAGGTVYTYDANGSLTSSTDAGGQITVYGYDFENRLVFVRLPSGAEIRYSYSPAGVLLRREAGAVVHYFPVRYAPHAGHPVREEGDPGLYLDIPAFSDHQFEYDETGYPLCRFQQGPGVDEHLSMRSSARTRFYHGDGLGNTRFLTDEFGELADHYRFAPFGLAIEAFGAAVNPYRFAGREEDPQAGLYTFRARHYDPAAGRFIQKDPLGMVSGTNLYTYVGNNPINHADPFGLQDPVDLSGRKGPQREKYRYTFESVQHGDLRTANIMISARDALEMKKTDEAAKILGQCKVIIISGGPVSGKEG